jgi:hypothetical protein
MRPSNKVFDYVVVLKQKNRRSVELIGLMAFAVFLAILLHHLITTDQHRIIVGLITLTSIGLFTNGLIQFKKRKKPDLIIAFVLAAFVIYKVLDLPWIGVLYIILTLIYSKSVKSIEIGFSMDVIVVNGLVQKRINWSELNNVLIKDGILTMDYKNNKLFQQETDELDDDEDDEVTEEEFNAFCETALKR